MNKPETISSVGTRLAELFGGLESSDRDYWTFDGRDERGGAHSLFHYPAMMVPNMQGALLDIVRNVVPNADRVLDPFVGSGTVMVESMLRGLNFTGIDINPLAILLSQVKADLQEPKELQHAGQRILARAKSDRTRQIYSSFENIEKWFSPLAAKMLSRLARAIQEEPRVEVRRCFWVVIANVAKLVCNSRPSTYKLHKRATDDVSHLLRNPIELFEENSEKVVGLLKEHYDGMAARHYIKKGRYHRELRILLKDSKSINAFEGVPAADIVITSPPYGDNHTTVPYGQYSFLPLQWIDLDDIATGIDRSCLENTHATDSASLGGSRANAIDRAKERCGHYEVFQDTEKVLGGNEDGLKRFCSFAADLDRSVEALASRTVVGGVHLWTVGERRINGIRVPLTQMLTEMLASRGVRLAHVANRRILSKRMAARNSSSETMLDEQLIVAYKQS